MLDPASTRHDDDAVAAVVAHRQRHGAVGGRRDLQRGRRRRRQRGRDAPRRVGRRAVDEVVVDVDRDLAVGLVVAALVLVQALVVRPVGRRDVGARDRLLVVPLGKPDVVGLEEGRAVLRDQVGDAGAGAAVDARQVALGVELRGPRRQEGEDRRRVGRGPRVALHVVVNGVAGRNPDALRVRHGIDRGRGALRGGLSRRDRRAPTRVARRLQAHVDRDHVPSGRHLVGDPGGAEVGLGASGVRAADVDPDRAVGRSAPSRHRGSGKGRCTRRTQALRTPPPRGAPTATRPGRRPGPRGAARRSPWRRSHAETAGSAHRPPRRDRETRWR